MSTYYHDATSQMLPLDASYTIRIVAKGTTLTTYVNGVRYDTRPATKKIRKLVRRKREERG